LDRKAMGVAVVIGFIWLWLGATCWLLGTRKRTFRFHKSRKFID